MPHQSFKSMEIITNKVKGIHFEETIPAANAVGIAFQIQQLQPRSTMIPTELDLSWGLNTDITSDTSIIIALSVIDVDNIPEQAAVRLDNAWQAAQKWHVASGSFTLPVQTLEQSDPRFFRPKAYRNTDVGAAVRRMALCVLIMGTAISVKGSGTVRYTEILTQRRFGNDNAYGDIEGNTAEFADDIGMQAY